MLLARGEILGERLSTPEKQYRGRRTQTHLWPNAISENEHGVLEVPYLKVVHVQGEHGPQEQYGDSNGMD